MKGTIERPFEIKIVVALEAFVAIRYLIYAYASSSITAPTANLAWLTYLILAVFSVLIAYGLWRFAKWAWLIAIILSALGIVSTVPLLLIGTSMDVLIQYIPSISLDMLTIFLLLRRSVRGLFWGTTAKQELPPEENPTRNP